MQYSGVQATEPRPLMVDASVQCELLTPIRTSTPEPEEADSSMSMDEEYFPSNMSIEEAEEETVLTSSSPMSSGSAPDKYIVFHEQLMELFSMPCTTCPGHCEGQVSLSRGTCVTVKAVCLECGLTARTWTSQPQLHRNMPAGNLMLSGAIFFSGCLASQTLRMLNILGVLSISLNTYSRHQRDYVLPVVLNTWQEQQQALVAELQILGGSLVVSGDCRSDSPGHCAKYGSYSVIEERINKVIDVQLVQVSFWKIHFFQIHPRNFFCKALTAF